MTSLTLSPEHFESALQYADCPRPPLGLIRIILTGCLPQSTWLKSVTPPRAGWWDPAVRTISLLPAASVLIARTGGIGICVAPPQETVIIDLMSEEWTFDYLEVRVTYVHIHAGLD